MFKTDGTVDKIFTGGAGKNGATVAVSEVLTSFSVSSMNYISCMCVLPFLELPLTTKTRIEKLEFVWGTSNP